MDGDQGRDAEAALILLAYLCARALGAHHHHGDVLTDLHAFFNKVEPVGIVKAGAFFHQRHHRGYHAGMLLVGSEVHHHVSGGDQFLIGAHGEAVLGGVLPRLALLADGGLPQGVGHVQTRVAQVEALIQALGAAADDDDFLALEVVTAVGEFLAAHKPALAEFLELHTQGQRIEVVLAHDLDSI